MAQDASMASEPAATLGRHTHSPTIWLGGRSSGVGTCERGRFANLRRARFFAGCSGNAKDWLESFRLCWVVAELLAFPVGMENYYEPRATRLRILGGLPNTGSCPSKSRISAF